MPNLAVVVGCNYRGEKRELKGCINDALAMWDMLTKRSGYQPSDIKLLTDDTPIKPTRTNIWEALVEMFNKAEPNDQLFFYFSGHGTKVVSEDEAKSGHGTILHREDEAIVCLDYPNCITRYDFRRLVNGLPIGENFLPRGAIFQMVSDSCNSGGLIDQEKEQIEPSRTSTTRRSRTATIPDDSRCKAIPFKSIIESLSASTGYRTSDVNIYPKKTSEVNDLMVRAFGDQASLMFRQSEDELASSIPLGDDGGILLSACLSNEKARELPDGGKYYGAFTRALIQVVLSDECDFECSHKMVMTKVTKVLNHKMEEWGLEDEQHPCLYCSDVNTGLCFTPMRGL